jgi:LysM repeat protein
MVQINQEFDRLKQKYQPALKLMQQLQMQVQVQNMGMKGTKQFIVKQIDPTFSDLVCDISVSQQPRQPVAQQAPSAMIAGASASGGQDQRRYTVKPGDTLYKISSQFYGDSNQYTKIFNANRKDEFVEHLSYRTESPG